MWEDRLPNCSALWKSRKCARLTVYYCQGEEYTFKQTCKEEIDLIQYAYNRLSSLDSSMQRYIAKKYYGGLMPWNKKQIVRTYSGYKRLGSL